MTSGTESASNTPADLIASRLGRPQTPASDCSIAMMSETVASIFCFGPALRG
jgi:hypothetical protein